MGHRREFEISFVGLKPGIHEYEYVIADRFFEAYSAAGFSLQGYSKTYP
jgi:hypothetical protein